MNSAALRCFAGLACVRFNYGYGMLVKSIMKTAMLFTILLSATLSQAATLDGSLTVSNTLTATADTHLLGKVGIGTNAPAATLDVRGASGTTLKVVDGNQAAGKVLTSDADGNASWQTAAGGTVKYIQLKMSANQGTLYNGYGVNFDTVFRSNGMTSGGNCINLKAGVTYRVEAGLDIYAATDQGYLGYTIANTAGVGLGVVAYAMNPASPSVDAVKNYIVVIYTPSVDENIYVKITDQRMGTGQIRSDFNPYFIATEMTSAGGGAVTSVSATGPLASSGGATPTLSILTASCSQAGALAAADWTTFNAKVGGSGTASYVPKFTASGTVSTSAIYSAANGNVGIGTTTPADLLQVGHLMFGGNSGREIYSTDGYDINYKATGSSAHHFYTSGTEKLTIDGTGKVGIGTAAPTYTLQVNGSLACVGSVNTSDARLKKDVLPISDALAIVGALRGVTYNLSLIHI